MRKMLLVAIATAGVTAFMAAPSQAMPGYEHHRREAGDHQRDQRVVEREVSVQPALPEVEVQRPVRVLRPVERKRIIVVRERERDQHRHYYYDRHGWTHRPHREVIIVRR